MNGAKAHGLSPHAWNRWIIDREKGYVHGYIISVRKTPIIARSMSKEPKTISCTFHIVLSIILWRRIVIFRREQMLRKTGPRKDKLWQRFINNEERGFFVFYSSGVPVSSFPTRRLNDGHCAWWWCALAFHRRTRTTLTFSGPCTLKRKWMNE